MSVPKQKQRLPLELNKLIIKLSSLFFQKMVLFEEEQESETKVRHYDLQCEGAEMLIGFLKTKHQNSLLKAFSAIRTLFPLGSHSSRQGTQKLLNGNTGRTYLNTTYTVSQSQPTSQRPLASVRSLRDNLHKKNVETSSRCSGDMDKLLKKVKETNSRNDSYSFRESLNNSRQGENCSFYQNQRSRNNLGNISYLEAPSKVKVFSYSGHSASFNYYQPRTSNKFPPKSNENNYKSQQVSKRGSRRQFIMNKFSNIQCGLECLQDTKQARSRINNEIMEEILNIKQRLRL